MAGTPTEYLSLPSAGPDLNFAQYTAGFGSPGTDVRTTFERIRIDPVTLDVDIDDQTFASSVGMLLHSGSAAVTEMPYAVAMSCGGPAFVGLANIDLTGTPFAIAGGFCVAGSGADGGFVLSANGQVADLTGTGFCGWTAPDNPCATSPQDGDSATALELLYGP